MHDTLLKLRREQLVSQPPGPSTAAAVYGAMDGQIIVPIGFAFAAVSVALFANFVEARGI
jgi:hypothetical protein